MVLPSLCHDSDGCDSLCLVLSFFIVIMINNDFLSCSILVLPYSCFVMFFSCPVDVLVLSCLCPVLFLSWPAGPVACFVLVFVLIFVSVLICLVLVYILSFVNNNNNNLSCSCPVMSLFFVLSLFLF